MERVAIFGRGGAGKSALARELGDATGLPIVELDKQFWTDQLKPLFDPAMGPSPVCDDRLAPLDHGRGSRTRADDARPRLGRADTIVVLDMPLWLCAWRAHRRGRERRDSWSWTLRWRRRSRPTLLQAIAERATRAEVVLLRALDPFAAGSPPWKAPPFDAAPPSSTVAAARLRHLRLAGTDPWHHPPQLLADGLDRVVLALVL